MAAETLESRIEALVEAQATLTREGIFNPNISRLTRGKIIALRAIPSKHLFENQVKEMCERFNIHGTLRKLFFILMEDNFISTQELAKVYGQEINEDDTVPDFLRKRIAELSEKIKEIGEIVFGERERDERGYVLVLK